MSTISASGASNISGTPGGRLSASDRLNALPVTSLHLKFVAVVGLSLFFDDYELFLTSILSTTLQRHFDVAASMLPLILASTFIGAFIGAAFFGRLADRIGRRKAFMITIAVYSLFSLAGAVSTGPWMLVLSRFVAGIGLGGEFPITNSYLGDILPARQRGRYTAWAFTLAYLGVPLVGFLGVKLVDVSVLGMEGWRMMFVIGALGGLITWVLRRGVPESPRWLESVGRVDEAERIVARFEQAAAREKGYVAAPVSTQAASAASGQTGGNAAAPGGRGRHVLAMREASALLMRPPLRGRFTLMGMVSFLYVFGYYGFGSLVPLVLVAKGLTVVHSLSYTAMSFIGYPIGSALSIPLMERFQRKYVLSGAATVMVIAGMGFGLANDSTLVVASGMLYTLSSNIMSNAYHIFMAEQFPTNVRATATGWLYSLSRIATGIVPFLLLPFLHAYGAAAMLSLVAAIMAVIVVSVAVFGVRTTGVSLEEINSPEPSAQDGSPRAMTGVASKAL
jgi:MFS transporter, putative metabolite:H+ symporter